MPGGASNSISFLLSKARTVHHRRRIGRHTGNGQTEAAQTLCRNIPSDQRRHLLAKNVGHYGIFSGRKFREMIYPQIRSFIHLVSQREADLKLVRVK